MEEGADLVGFIRFVTLFLEHAEELIEFNRTTAVFIHRCNQLLNFFLILGDPE